MLFPSISFIFLYFPIVVALYYLFSFSKNLQKIWLIISSLVFYIWGEISFFWILIISLTLNTISALSITHLQHFNKKSPAKTFLFLTIFLNIGILIFFRYMGFIFENLNALLQSEVFNFKTIAMPLGIAFFTLRGISYNIDCFTKKIEKHSIIDTLFYLSFFPFILAGPLATFNELLSGKTSKIFDSRRFSVGMCRFTIGLAKKILIADRLKVISDQVFNLSMIGNNVYEIPVLLAWIGLIAFAIQIYYDVSGYADMAIGIGLCLGYKVKENVDYPYAASSVTEFFNRFQISLLNWFHLYVEKPLLGKDAMNKDRIMLSVFLMWLIFGLWHGPSLTFVFWGIWNALFVMIEKIEWIHILDPFPKIKKTYSLIAVVLGFVLFRAEDLYQAAEYYKNLFGLNYNQINNDLVFIILKEYVMVFILGIIFLFPIAQKMNQWQIKHPNSWPVKVNTFVYPIILLGVFILSFIYLSINPAQSFIYYFLQGKFL